MLDSFYRPTKLRIAPWGNAWPLLVVLSVCCAAGSGAQAISGQSLSLLSLDSERELDGGVLWIASLDPELGPDVRSIIDADSDTGQQTPLPDSPQPSKVAQANAEAGTQCAKPPCLGQRMNWYKRFVNGPKVKPLTPEEKGWLALRNATDPFNAITILGEAGIAVGSNAHSPYGPGMPGYGRYVGVSYTEDLTGEFFNTFLIPSIAHQDPHYHRMPHASYFRRGLHCVTQVIWTQGDNERGMLNYANLVGFAIDDQIGNLYVPGRRTNGAATAERYATGLASAPISNIITEFLPDVASHIHVQVVIVQRIINQVARTESGGQ